MQVNEILPKLANVRKSQSGWLALCPSHDDTKQSLSIKDSDGKVLMKCFAGCDTQNVVSALDLEMKDLFSETKDKTKNFQTKTIEAVYQYTDENGKVLYENVRYYPKDFRLRKPDGNGGFDYSLGNVRRVPYRLPEMLKAIKDEADIFLCEGEKDADNLRELGLTASSFKHWKSEFNQYVKGANIVILSDHDKAGKLQSEKAAKILSADAESIRIVDFFAEASLPEKSGKDVSDWIEAKRLECLTDEEIAERLCISADFAETWQPNFNAEIESYSEETEDFQSLFLVQDANVWIQSAKLRPIPKMLFGEFWFEGELCILFADTGKGKSILAVQIANSISKGEGINNFTLEAEKQKILYFDFELSDKQFEARYSLRQADFFTNHYFFDENFKRGEINPNGFVPDGFKDFQEYLNYSLEFEVANTGAKVLIVDNITYLKNATETAKDALPLMKELIRLKKKYQISILALAHTPKRDLSRPLTVNDLQGSKMLSNFADSIFAIGESGKDKSLRYLKQIKARNTEEIYHSENVITCQISKPDNFLMFEFIGFGNEREHLKVLTDNDKAELIQKVKDLSALGESQRKIAIELGLSLGTVNNYLKR